MDEARSRDAWRHTSSLLAMLYNVNRTKGRPQEPSAFDPYTRADAKARIVTPQQASRNWEILAKALPAMGFKKASQ